MRVFFVQFLVLCFVHTTIPGLFVFRSSPFALGLVLFSLRGGSD